MKILVVEDSPIVRTACVTLLSKLNYQVDFAADGLKALIMAKKKYDVILMDVYLPHINGIDITCQLRHKENKRKVGNPIIIGATGDKNQDLYKMCIQAGMNEVLYKPVSTEQIFATIIKHLPHEKCLAR